MRYIILALVLMLLMSVAFLARSSQPPLSAGEIIELSERTFELSYQFTVNDLSGGSQVYAWIPFPPSNSVQRLLGYKIDSALPYEIVIDPEYGNRYFQFDLSESAASGSEAPIKVTYTVKRFAYNALLEKGDYGELPQNVRTRLLSPDNLIPLDGKIAAEAREVAGDIKEPLTRCRKIYDHIVDSITYDKSGEGWGRGDAVYACDIRAGNCTDFHSLFIGEARSLGVPSRFIMGIPLPEDKTEGIIPGYHCWAEFYIEGYGWVPIDASEAHKNPRKREAFFGGLDANRIQLTIGRDIKVPGATSDPLNYSFYPHVEVDGVVYEDIDVEFSFRDI